jgi:hypothetical protein
MKSKQYEFAVYSAGRMAAGGFAVKRAIGIERATQKVAWKAQADAHKNGWEFDLMNFSIAVRPIYEN